MKYTKKRKIYKKRSNRRRNKSRVTKRFRKRTYRLNGGGGQHKIIDCNNNYNNVYDNVNIQNMIRKEYCPFLNKSNAIDAFIMDNKCSQDDSDAKCENIADKKKLAELKNEIKCNYDLTTCKNHLNPKIIDASEKIIKLRERLALARFLNALEIDENYIKTVKQDDLEKEMNDRYTQLPNEDKEKYENLYNFFILGEDTF